jgi:hypothetical protein
MRNYSVAWNITCTNRLQVWSIPWIPRFERRSFFESNDWETQVQKVRIDPTPFCHLFTVVAPAGKQDSSTALNSKNLY